MVECVRGMPKATIRAVDNLTHSLVGATLAELALPAAATRVQRRVFFVAGILAANLPDADLVYTWITPPPLGSLLHHRGHTHTVVGLAAQALLLVAVYMLPAIRRNVDSLRRRLGMLIAVALASHLVLDSWNSYGVHPFWPLDSRWFYGDAIYILEPWLWLLLGAAAALNTRHQRGRLVLSVTLMLFPLALLIFGMIPVAALIALALTAGGIVLLTRGWPAHRRSGVALALSAAFVTSMFALSSRVHEEALASVTWASRSEIVDVVLSPQAANPLCWTVLALAIQEPRAEYVTSRGAAAAFGGPGCGSNRAAAVVWGEQVRHSLPRLRDLYARDCWVRGWMQFGRVPEIKPGSIGDLRYGQSDANFTTMALRSGDAAAQCPPNLTSWGRPRADLLGLQQR